jgi:cyanophycin synthetase
MGEDIRRWGFWPGLRQPSCGLVMQVKQPEKIDFSVLDDWLVKSFGLELQVQPPLAITDPNAQSVAALVWRVLQLGLFLQQEAQTPVFEVGSITRVTQDPQHTRLWHVGIRVPFLDFMNPNALKMTYSKATKCIGDLIDSAVSTPNMSALLQDLEGSVIKPLRAMNKSGVSTLPVLREAFRQDITYRHLSEGIYQLGWGCHARLLDRSVIDTDSSIGSKLVNKKHWAARILRSAGLPAPVHTLVTTEAQALASAESMGWPLVIKPADRERSEGVTVSIYDRSALVQAYQHAAKLSKLILVERHVAGICFRVMVADGKVLYAVRRRPVAVLGDGAATIAQLITHRHLENERLLPWRRAKSISLDAHCLQALKAQGYTPEDVPAAGTRVALRLIESTEWGGDVEDATDEIHPDNVAIAEKAARLFRLGNAGVDIISTDISKPWHETGAIINEVNFAPHFGATSAARRLMPVFLKRYVTGDGRIPVEVFVGGPQAMVDASSRQAALCDSGLACFVTSHTHTFGPQGKLTVMPCDGIFERAMALLTNQEVQALVMVIQNDALLKTGLPVDCLSSVQLVSNAEGSGLSATDLTRLLQLLQHHTKRERSNA